MADDGLQEIILDPVDAERQPAAALFLSGCFSLPPAATRRIVAAAPIAILSGLSAPQAEGVLKELGASLPEGVNLRAANAGETADAGRLEWPNPPQIHGRDLEEFGRTPHQAVAPCPSCGKMLKITYDAGDGVKLGLSGISGKTILIPNPASAASDKDPLFSGFKPLAEGVGNLASLRSLQAGDSSFWMEARQNFFPRPAPEAPADWRDAPLRGRSDAEARDKREESASSSSYLRTGGLASFMKQGLYSVVLSRTRDPQTIKMLSEIMGVEERDAQQLASSRSLCVARNIALDEAQTLLARFRSLGANARIVKPM